MPYVIAINDKSLGTLLEDATNHVKPRNTESIDRVGKIDNQLIQESEEVEIEKKGNVNLQDFEDMVEYLKHASVEQSLDLYAIIRLMALSALAMVKDQQVNSDRTTARITIILELLNHDRKGLKN